MKIILAGINAKYIHTNSAIYSLQESAGQVGVPVEIAEFTINQPKDQILGGLYRLGADVLCISCFIWNIRMVEQIARELRKIRPEMPIWLGGPEVSYYSGPYLERHPYITGIMKGEGEKTFQELVLYYSRHEGTLDKMPGISYRDEAGLVHENPWRQVMDLSEAPWLYEDLAKFDNRILYYETSRGCPFHCSYCLSSADKKLRFRNLDLVRRELQFFLDHKVPQVKFVDRTFNCRHDHAMAIWKYLKEHDNGVTNFHFEIEADLLTEEELDFLATLRPGQIQMEIGVQSTNPETIREIHRTMSLEKLYQVVTRLNAGHNIHLHLDLIAGLPYEDYPTFAKSFDDVYRLHPEQLQLGFLKLLKGAYMYDHAGEYGIVCQEEPPYEILRSDWLSYPEILRLKDVEEMLEVYYNSGQFQHLITAIGELYASPFRFYEELGDWYRERGELLRSHTRMDRSRLLLAFLCERWPQKKALFEDLAVLDLYARENMKSRPDFGTDQSVYKDVIRNFFRSHEAELQEKLDAASYDWKQMARQFHVEIFSTDVLGRKTEKPYAVLFDYRRRNPLTQNGILYPLKLDSESELSL